MTDLLVGEDGDGWAARRFGSLGELVFYRAGRPEPVDLAADEQRGAICSVARVASVDGDDVAGVVRAGTDDMGLLPPYRPKVDR